MLRQGQDQVLPEVGKEEVVKGEVLEVEGRCMRERAVAERSVGKEIVDEVAEQQHGLFLSRTVEMARETRTHGRHRFFQETKRLRSPRKFLLSQTSESFSGSTSRREQRVLRRVRIGMKQRVTKRMRVRMRAN